MDFERKTAHIVYASDDRFSEILGVSLISLYENSQDMEDIVVYILDSGISADNKKKLSDVCERYDYHELIWIPVQDIRDEISMKVTIDRGSPSQYARLFVSSALPKTLSRVLYLDCDVIINRSISGLWNIDLNGKMIGALMDAYSKYYRRNIGLQPDDIMFNSGVMLIDLEKWRRQDTEKNLLKFILEKRGNIQQGDQGALNAVLSHDTYCFEPCFNALTIFFDFTYDDMMIYRKPPYFYSKEEIINAVEHPVVIHFTTSFLSKRPWMKECRHRYAGQWIKYKSMSPWAADQLWEDDRPLWKRSGFRIYKFLPHAWALWIAGLLQAYGRPIVNSIKK